MNRLVCSVIFLLYSLAAVSQKEYFIYLQAETEQSFFVRLNEKTYNSTPGGYLILSNLKDSSYTFKIGFPQNKWPDQQFSVPIRSKDHGFLLKNFGEKGWGLFDLQTMGVQMADQNAKEKALKSEPVEVSAFTEILAKAANDPSLKEKPVFASMRTEEKPATIQPEPKKEEPVVVKEKEQAVEKSKNISQEEIKREDSTIVAKAQPQKEQSADLKPQSIVDSNNISKSELKNQDSLTAAKKEVQKNDEAIKTQTAPNVDKASEPLEKKTDSLALAKTAQKEEPTFVKDQSEQNKSNPSGSPVKENDSTAIAKTEAPKELPSTPDKQQTVPKTEVVEKTPQPYKRSTVTKKSESSTTEGFGLTFVDEYADGQKDTIQLIIPNSKTILEIAQEQQADQRKFLDITSETKEYTPPVKKLANNPCTSLASENDFFRLRKKMAGQKEDELMINEAKKEFKSKCFSVEQIKNLGNLFFSEAGKFQFYEVAYPNSSDKSGFTNLQAEFKDPYFVHRFKSLVN